MISNDNILFIAEFLGSVAFAVSGTLVAIRKKLDYFGIIVLATITTVSGGMIRDVILGNIPPQVFFKPIFAGIAVFTAIIVILALNRLDPSYIKKVNSLLAKSMLYFDAIGLGAFTATGLIVSLNTANHSAFLCIFVAVITGVGGGIVRDLLVSRIPLVLTREIYANASIVGAAAGYWVYSYWGEMACIYATVVITSGIRIVAIQRNVHLPRVERFGDGVGKRGN